MKDSRTPAMRQIKTSEKQTEGRTAKEVWDSYDQPTVRQKPSSKPGLPVEKRMKQEKRRWHVLTNEHNRLTFAVNEEEAKLKQLQESLKATNHNNEDASKQRMRKLENNRDKMKMKIIEATEIQTAYEHIREHLQQEFRGMFMLLDHKQQAVAAGHVKVDRASKQFRSAAADSTMDSMLQMEDETMRMKREMECELFKLNEEDDELQRQMELLEPLNLIWKIRQKQKDMKEQSDHQCFEICGASPSEMKLVDDMNALGEATGYVDVQELVDKVVSQRTTTEHLLAEIAQYEDVTRHEAEVLAELELKYTQLQFRAKPTATRVEMQAELNQTVVQVQRLQAELKQSQDLLDTAERGVNNLYFRMRCVPVEGMPSAPSEPSADCTDRLGDVRDRLPTLLQRALTQEPVISGLDQ